LREKEKEKEGKKKKDGLKEERRRKMMRVCEVMLKAGKYLRTVILC